MAIYDVSSPYYNTLISNDSLSIMVDRKIPKYADDTRFIINQVYAQRPDLLAHDLYDDARLWWVFANRNPNTLQDPLFDFAIGTTIYLPKIDTLKSALGI